MSKLHRMATIFVKEMIDQLKQYGYNETDISKIQAVMKHPLDYQHALQAGNFNEAFLMTQPQETKSETNLSEWFSVFVEKEPEDAKSLSAAMSKFSRWIQSEVDKKKAL